MPPTVLIGFGDDNRLLYNDMHTGYLVVKKGMITPQVISSFVATHMSNPNLSIEETLLYPKFVIRTVGTRCTNDVKIYFSKEPML